MLPWGNMAMVAMRSQQLRSPAWIKAIYTLHRWEQEAAPLAEELLATEGYWERKFIFLWVGVQVWKVSHPSWKPTLMHTPAAQMRELKGGKHCRVRPKWRGCGVGTMCTRMTDEESVQTTVLNLHLILQ